jgi:flagellar basal-body rod protein FlgC
MPSLFNSLEISATGLSAERLRMNVIASNIANANTVDPASGQPFKRKAVILESMTDKSFSLNLDDSLKAKGVEVTGIVEDNSLPTVKYEPSNPMADENGFVKMSNVNVLNEMVDMISASRAYEANVTAIDATKTMIKKAISITNL